MEKIPNQNPSRREALKSLLGTGAILAAGAVGIEMSNQEKSYDAEHTRDGIATIVRKEVQPFARGTEENLLFVEADGYEGSYSVSDSDYSRFKVGEKVPIKYVSYDESKSLKILSFNGQE